MVRLVQIKSHQELLTTRPPPTDVLDFSSACTGRGGASAALPDVKSFFSALDPDLPSESVVTLPRLKNTQRRRPAPDPDRPMGMADGGFMRQQIAHTRTAADQRVLDAFRQLVFVSSENLMMPTTSLSCVVEIPLVVASE